MSIEYRAAEVSCAGSRASRALEKFALDQRGKDLLVTHSAPYVRAQLAVLRPTLDAARELTDTLTADYKIDLLE